MISHSGSRGAGAAVCRVYSDIARAMLPKRYEDLGRLAWLEMDSEAGQEYWAAMNLMGDYAAANHDVIHRHVAQRIGAKPLASVENHHNFAWLEEHGGKRVYVHRKGATPARVCWASSPARWAIRPTLFEARGVPIRSPPPRMEQVDG